MEPKKLILPEGIEILDVGSVKDTTITELVIPKSVHTIKQKAFSQFLRLESLTF